MANDIATVLIIEVLIILIIEETQHINIQLFCEVWIVVTFTKFISMIAVLSFKIDCSNYYNVRYFFT